MGDKGEKLKQMDIAVTRHLMRYAELLEALAKAYPKKNDYFMHLHKEVRLLAGDYLAERSDSGDWKWS